MILFLALLLLQTDLFGRASYNIMDSGGPLLPEQAAYNVFFYDLNFHVQPEDSSLGGRAVVHAKVIEHLPVIKLDFDTVFVIHSVRFTEPEDRSVRSYTMPDGLLRITPDLPFVAGETFAVEIVYSGKPRIAENPPWSGGFTWGRTPDGEPFIGVSCQGNGANIWWPNKDHPSDRADSVSVSVRVPDDLTALSNGRSRGSEYHGDGTKTFHWFTSTPINNYAVSVNIAPYDVITTSFVSVAGDTVPVYFWHLPENKRKAERLLTDIKQQMAHFEKLLGPYPFRADKYGIAEAPFFGMEHQTLIAYGAGYRNDTVFRTGSGFDDLHHHELAHEWWGNMVAAADWKDFWIHEGFGTYMQPLYAEHLHGKRQYHHFMQMIRDRISNDYPVAPEVSMTASEMFRGRDPYMKGAWVLHMLRYQMGDETFFTLLRRFAYPTEEMERITDGSHMRHATTEEFIALAESLNGKPLDWFFTMYLRQPQIPRLVHRREGTRLIMFWQTPDDLPFYMPVQVQLGGNRITVPVSTRRTAIQLGNVEEYQIDPDNWILFWRR